MSAYSIPLRLKRLRKTSTVRAMMQETHLHPQDFIAPLFIHETLEAKIEIKAMPGQYQLSLGCLDKEIESLSKLGIPAVILFGIPAHKDPQGNSSLSSTGVIQQAIRRIRQINSDLVIIADVCFCEYTDHGHCGILEGQGIDNDATLTQLAHQAISYADAGADWVAPSGMTDGMVGVLRNALDTNGHHQVSILSYAVKYNSSLYGPFRQAALGAPQFGDRKSYQINPANIREALREATLDVEEGADILMVKPAMSYLDVICQVKQYFPEIPLCAYQVSGEYAMIKAAASLGFMEEDQLMYESLLSIKRAGADLIISYFAKDIVKLLR